MKKSRPQSIYSNLEEHFHETSDAKFQPLKRKNIKVDLIYLKTVTDSEKIQNLLVKPFFEMNQLEDYEYYIQSLAEYKEYQNIDTTLKDILRGTVVMLIEDKPFLFEFKLQKNTSILDVSAETTIHGPQTGLSEDLSTNLNLIRHRYHKDSLITEKMEGIGCSTNMELFLIYDDLLVNKKTLEMVKTKLDSIDKDVVQTAGELVKILTKRKSLFPTLLITERPDRISYNLALGKIIIMIEGNPFSIVAPAVFFDFMSSMEDLYLPYWIAKFLVFLRYMGLFISILLPAVYVGVSSYNPELFRVQLALSIAGSRSTVPFPSYLEVLFMLLMMELLVEASIRLPKSIGPTATTVGGLILGTAATEAGLVSNIMVIIVSAVAISNFVIPINEMGFAMRVVKYILLLFATISGLLGVVIGLIGLLFYLVSLDSLGQPYLKFFYSEKKINRAVIKDEL